MASDASSLTLSYESFGKLWKALVSKRKARKLNVDRDQVWNRLLRGGGDADLLGAPGASTSLTPGKDPDAMQDGGVAKSAAKTTKAAAASIRNAAGSETAPAPASAGRQSTRSGQGAKRPGKKRTANATPRRKPVAKK